MWRAAGRVILVAGLRSLGDAAVTTTAPRVSTTNRSTSHTSDPLLAQDVLNPAQMRHAPSRDSALPSVQPGTAIDAPRQTRSASPEEVSPWIRGEFNEMPDLRVTSEQAARLWGLDLTLARATLRSMVDAGFLVCAGNVYRRTT